MDGARTLERTVSPTTSATGSFDLISATMPEDVVIAAILAAEHPRMSRGLSRSCERHSSRLSSFRQLGAFQRRLRTRVRLSLTRPHHTAPPNRRPMQAVPPNPHTTPGVAGDARRAAFRDLHGPRLHGFALLLTLGDRRVRQHSPPRRWPPGPPGFAELSHPERAAAWLRTASSTAPAAVAVPRAEAPSDRDPRRPWRRRRRPRRRWPRSTTGSGPR